MLTKRQKQALDYIEGYAAAHGGVPPSYREIKEALGSNSTGNVHRLVHCLVERGHVGLASPRGASRGLRLKDRLEPQPEPKIKPRIELTAANAAFWRWNGTVKCWDRWAPKK